MVLDLWLGHHRRFGADGGGDRLRFYFVSVLGERVLTDIRRAVFDHLMTLDSTFFDTHRVGELTSRLNGDVATIRGAVGFTLASQCGAS